MDDLGLLDKPVGAREVMLEMYEGKVCRVLVEAECRGGVVDLTFDLEGCEFWTHMRVEEARALAHALLTEADIVADFGPSEEGGEGEVSTD